jgi:hypothetical protein
LTFGIFVLLAANPRLEAAAPEETDWLRPLTTMTLPVGMTLARSNAVRLVLQSFSSNATVKALVVAPGVIDDFHLIHRDAPPLQIQAHNVGDALMALTNSTSTRLSYNNSILFWHTAADALGPDTRGEPTPSLFTGWNQCSLPRILWIDAHWETVQPTLKKSMRLTVEPAAKAQSAWHFERVNLAANGLSNLEVLRAVAVGTGTHMVLRKRTITFERP